MTAAELLKDLKNKIDGGLVDPDKQVYVELYKGYSVYHQYEEGHHPYRTIPIHSAAHIASTDPSDPEDKTYNLAIGVF